VTFFSYGSAEQVPRRFSRRPSWAGAPDNWVPGTLPVSLVVARAEELAVSVSRIACYPDGFEFELATTSKTPSEEHHFPMGRTMHGASGCWSAWPMRTVRARL